MTIMGHTSAETSRRSTYSSLATLREGRECEPSPRSSAGSITLACSAIQSWVEYPTSGHWPLVPFVQAKAEVGSGTDSGSTTAFTTG